MKCHLPLVKVIFVFDNFPSFFRFLEFSDVFRGFKNRFEKSDFFFILKIHFHISGVLTRGAWPRLSRVESFTGNLKKDFSHEYN